MIRSYNSIQQQLYAQRDQFQGGVAKLISNILDTKLDSGDWAYIALVFYKLPREQCIRFIKAICPNAQWLDITPRTNLACLWLEHRWTTSQSVSLKTLAQDFADNGFNDEAIKVQQLFPSGYSTTNYQDVLTDKVMDENDYEYLLNALVILSSAESPAFLRMFGGLIGVPLEHLPQHITASELVNLIKNFDLQIVDEQKLKWKTVATAFEVLGKNDRVMDITYNCAKSKAECEKIIAEKQRLKEYKLKRVEAWLKETVEQKRKILVYNRS